ncbi:MAG: endo alpha-1,4 polygalactosaminidase [Nannocystaceae bacterium]|nr:endo alpha-1,4 polygalactosaminidase [Nannocystaceae bacterium]
MSRFAVSRTLEGVLARARRRLLVSVLPGALVCGCSTVGDVLARAEGDSTSDGSDADTTAGDAPRLDAAAPDLGPADDACGSMGAWWCPTTIASWGVQRYVPIDDAVVAEVLSVPLFQIDATDVATWASQGRTVVCSFSAGISTWNDPDRAMVLDATGPEIVPGQPERWMDTTSPVVREAMRARLDQAVASGCVAVEPFDLHGWLEQTGLALTQQTATDYAAFLADAAHARGLGFALSGVPALADALAASSDLAIDYACLVDDACGAYDGFREGGKLVLHAEVVAAETVGNIEMIAATVCAESAAWSMTTIFKKPDLGVWHHACNGA